MYHNLLINSNVNVHLDCFFFFTFMNNAAGNIPVFLWTSSFHIYIELGVELLGFMVLICFTF